jgi:hypothetical protein
MVLSAINAILQRWSIFFASFQHASHASQSHLPPATRHLALPIGRFPEMVYFGKAPTTMRLETEPIGSIPRPRELLEAIQAHAAGKLQQA